MLVATVGHLYQCSFAFQPGKIQVLPGRRHSFLQAKPAEAEWTIPLYQRDMGRFRGRPRPAMPKWLNVLANIASGATRQGLLKEQMNDLEDRLYTAPYAAEPFFVPDEMPLFDLEEIERALEHGHAGPGSPSASPEALCDALRRFQYVAVRLPPTAAPVMRGMWSEADRFFGLSDDVKFKAGGHMTTLDNAPGVIGYGRMPDSNEFLEMRLGHANSLQPPTLGQELPGFDQAMLPARGFLFRVAAAVVGSAERETNFRPHSVLSLMDDGSGLAPGEVTSTQLRLCHYTNQDPVPFEAHTDTTFVTVIPASSIAGLEVHNAEQGWVRPEAACPRDDRTVIVMPGEFLQVVTCGFYQAAVHRVTRDQMAANGGGRKSAPLLVRGKWDAKIFPQALSPSALVHEAMKEVDGMQCRQLHSILLHRMDL